MAEAATIKADEGRRGRSPGGEVIVTRRARFNAAHRLHNPDKSESWNLERFGRCNNANWHGHNYTVEVSVKGRPDPETGCVINLDYLKKLMDEVIVEPCDHKNLNLDVAFLKGMIPSTENLAVAIWDAMKPHIHEGKLYSVRIHETENNTVEYRG